MKRDRAFSRRSLRASGVLLSAWAAAAAHAGNVQPLLRFGDAEVSTSAAARVVFSSRDALGDADVVCAPADACTIPASRHSIRLDSPDYVALDRPTFVSDTDASSVPTPFALPFSRVTPRSGCTAPPLGPTLSIGRRHGSSNSRRQESRQEYFVGGCTGTTLHPSYKVEGLSCVNEINLLKRSRSAAGLVVSTAVRPAPFPTRGSGIPDTTSSAPSSER